MLRASLIMVVTVPRFRFSFPPHIRDSSKFYGEKYVSVKDDSVFMTQVGVGEKLAG